MNQITTLYIVRHLESEHNVKNLLGVIPGASLKPKGIDQAKLLAKKLQNIHFKFITSKQ